MDNVHVSLSCYSAPLSNLQVCFHSRHLTCFAYDHQHKNWVHYNDAIVEVSL